MPFAQVVSLVRFGRPSWRVAVVLGLTVPILAWTFSLPPIAQDLSYHDFADKRELYGVPHFWNVLSNVPFAAVGLLGCWWLHRNGKVSGAFQDPSEGAVYWVFFLGGFLTCFGSSYYHAAPANDTLVWDRLVLSLMLTSMFTIVVTEFVNPRFGRAMLVPMVVLGLFSVLYWMRTEMEGQGDLRLYFLVQFYPMLAMPIIMLLFRSRYTHGGVFWLLLLLYAVAKVAELYDDPILDSNGLWSGHTVKHLIAAGASYIPLYGLRHRTRRPGAESTSVALSARMPQMPEPERPMAVPGIESLKLPSVRVLEADA